MVIKQIAHISPKRYVPTPLPVPVDDSYGLDEERMNLSEDGGSAVATYLRLMNE